MNDYATERGYWLPEYEYQMSPEDLKNSDRDTQTEVMRTWFFEHFEDPANSTPYESAEGGYIYIWGGPYDAQEELEDEFSGVVPFEVIEELANELSETSFAWTGIPSGEDFDDYVLEDIASISEFLSRFQESISDITEMLSTPFDSSVAHCFYRLLYANVITALETYLSDAFINSVLQTPQLLRRFIEATPEFQKEKVSVSDIFKEFEAIETRARRYIGEVRWHNLARVKPMYRDTLGIEFPTELDKLFNAILTRHDIVHRNGKTKDGEERVITIDGVRRLVTDVESFVDRIDSQLRSGSIQPAG
jgi:hypothetical protein